MPVADASSQRPLFGGAIVADLPASWKDVSDFRQVPDNQEVFVSPESDASGETSLIVEVLERVAPADAEDAVRFHFNSIAHDNDAESSHVLRTWARANHDSGYEGPIQLCGTQEVKKFGRATGTAQRVRIWVALWRIAAKNIDLVLSVNAAGHDDDDDETSTDAAEVIFERAVRSLHIRDYGLFA